MCLFDFEGRSQTEMVAPNREIWNRRKHLALVHIGQAVLLYGTNAGVEDVVDCDPGPLICRGLEFTQPVLVSVDTLQTERMGHIARRKPGLVTVR